MDNLKQLIQQLNVGAVDEVLAADCRMVMPNGATLGRDEIEEMSRAMRLAFPDLHWEMSRAVVNGDTVAAELCVSGAHDGPLHTGVNAIPPTGARVSYRTCDVITFRDGK